jgi:CheY-like chemotaxis protein
VVPACSKTDGPHEVLVIDDNPGDAQLIRLAWAECSVVTSNISVLTETRDAIKYLRGVDPYEDSRIPDLILLDYKMPLNGGLALTDIKGDPDYLYLPVLVFTRSSNPEDYLEAYRRGANCCFRKTSNPT